MHSLRSFCSFLLVAIFCTFVFQFKPVGVTIFSGRNSQKTGPSQAVNDGTKEKYVVETEDISDKELVANAVLVEQGGDVSPYSTFTKT